MYMYLPNREKTENYFFEEKKKIVRLSRFSAFFTREGPYFSSFQYKNDQSLTYYILEMLKESNTTPTEEQWAKQRLLNPRMLNC